MAVYNIDTAEAIERISSSGLPRKQAVAIVAAFAESNEQVATRNDIELVKSDIELVKSDIERVEERLGAQIKEFRAELKTDIAELRTELKTDIADLRTELKTDIGDLRTEFAKQRTHLILWIIGTGIALFGGERILNLFLGG